ncbi:MAG: FGGY-family carbohydrate kinase [Spirochaetaceae bacterium]|nr:FGGY-family carbohydrate kinase [Spirochaetaceae bacterium]MCF7948335.1 FGGY-family carbohydrate kinase [Spirochaetia bacterium]MCF7952435.1 FGGY-family carbohydrate kinase [Spirochaetaceae bacterium]
MDIETGAGLIEINKAKRPLVCAVDVGTSSLKAGLIDAGGSLIEWARVPFELEGQGPLETWPAEAWWDALLSALHSFSKPSLIAALAISGHGPTIVPIDRNGKTLSEASLWINKRDKAVPGEPSFFLPKVSWLAQNKPEVYDRTAAFLGCPEYLAFRLTGELSAFTPSGEFAPYIWNESGISAYGFDAAKFPSLLKTGKLVGKVDRYASEMSGVSPGTPVVATGADFLMSLLGTAVTVPGRTCDRTGTSEGINCCSDRKIVHPQIRCLPHTIEGMYNIAGILSSTGRIFEWFRSFSNQKHRSYYQMLKEVAEVNPSNDLPYFFPSLHRGAVWEFSGGAFTGLEAHHGAAEMGRAVVSSIGFGIRDLIEKIEEEECEVVTLRVSGGQGRNTIWNQMKSDITGKVIEVPRIIDAELTGGAIAAFTYLGTRGSLTSVAEELVKIDERYEPDQDAHQIYSEEYNYYTRHCDRIIAALADTPTSKTNS